MADINHVVLVGRLTRDADLKYTNTGLAICNFSIAVNRRRKQGDQWVEEASFFNVVLMGRMGEAISQYLVKGKQVGVEGELRQNKWEQDGQPRSRVEIFANNIQLLGGRGGSGGGSGGYDDDSSYNSRPPRRNEQTSNNDDQFEDDIPF
jgi:single-strand DNA-binding protein